MKVFISADLEGAAGIVDWAQCGLAGGAAYAEGCRLLLGEVNAAIEGAFAGGATWVLVNDSHGAMANLPPDGIAGGSSYLSGRHKPLYMMEGLDSSFGAVIFLAYHGSMGSSGTLSHTYNPRAISGTRLNGEVVGESGINALVAASLGVPIVLLTGDQVACDEVRSVAPDCEAVAVKRSITRFAGESLHPALARDLIRHGAEVALRRCGDAMIGQPRVSLPVRLEVDWLTADMAELATAVRGVERAGPRTVVIEGDEPLGCYRSFVATIAITRSIVEA